MEILFLHNFPAATHFLSRAIFIAVYTFFSVPDLRRGNNKLKTFLLRLYHLSKNLLSTFLHERLYFCAEYNEGVRVYGKNIR